jgi:hypothetical protein
LRKKYVRNKTEESLKRLFVCGQKVSISILASTHDTFLSKDQSNYPIVHISYECVLRERLRESASYLYEIACSVAYPATSAHLSLRVTGQNTYRNIAAREIPFTRHEAGATAYVELLEAEQLEVRIVEHEGTYCKAFYYAHGEELIEQNARRVVSAIQRIESGSQTEQHRNLE